MFYKFRLRQSAVGNQYGDKDVNIHKFFEKNYLQKQNIDEKPPKDLKDLVDDKFAPLRKDVISYCDLLPSHSFLKPSTRNEVRRSLAMTIF